MGIAPYKYFTYDGESSRDYDVYLTGTGVFNAPERAVEMVEIPGRNGNYALDQGKFNNISVTYKAGIVDYSESDFADKVSAVRNWLCSKVGYKRLSDDYNPNEYRMAVFRSGVEIDHVDLKTGEFEITFDCKPQRWLTSGETKSSVSSGSTINNPTLFDASPLIECKGYGNILIRGIPITISSVPIGNILLSNGATFNIENAEQTAYHDPAEMGSIVLNVSNLNTGDDVYVAESIVTYNITARVWDFSSTSVSSESGESWTTTSAISNPSSAYFRTAISKQTFKKGTSSTKTYEYMLHYEMDGGYVTTSSLVTIKIAYDGNQTVKLYASTFEDDTSETYELVGYIGQINGFSTVVANKTFNIDLDIGEAYYIDNNVYSSANYAVNIPAILPTLRPGNNTITYDNTITNFKIAPRWWKV